MHKIVPFVSVVLIILVAVFTAPKVFAMDIPDNITVDYANPDDDVLAYFNQAVSMYKQSVGLSVDDDVIVLLSDLRRGYNTVEIFISSPTDSNPAWSFTSSGSGITAYGSGMSSFYYYYTSGGNITFGGNRNAPYFNFVKNGINYTNFTSISSSNVAFTLYFMLDSWGDNSATKYGYIDSVSDAGLLSELYDITFTVQGVSSEDYNNLVSRVYAVAPVAVRDDSGYNMISLQCPQMQINEDIVVWGYYLFKPRYSDLYFFDGLKLSFGYDPLNDSDLGSELPLYPTSDYYGLFVDNNPVRSSGLLTVNSISFIYGTQIRSANNREYSIYDYNSNDDDLYPTFMLHSIGSINMYSLGSICYNFDDSGLSKLDDNDNIVKIDNATKLELSEKGNNRAKQLIDELGYIPVTLNLHGLNDNFQWDNSQTYDFSSVSELLGSIFVQPFIVTLMTACAVVGLIGLVLYGKR